MTKNKFYSRLVSAMLALTIGAGSGLMLNSLAEFPTNALIANSHRYAYMIDQNGKNQTRIMMDGNNFLKDGFWMNAQLELVNEDALGMDTLFNVNLVFKIPGYDSSNLKFFIFDKNPQHPQNIMEYELSSSAIHPIPSIYVTNLQSSSYEVHVYNGSLAEENFVAKAEFTLWPNKVFFSQRNVENLVDSAGRPIYGATGNVLQLAYMPPVITQTDQFQLALPLEVIPYYARTIKAVFFAKNRPNEGPPSIDQTLYDYFYSGTVPAIDENTVYLEYAVDAGWGTQQIYEVHFYVDEVLPENFICKAENVNFNLI